VRLKADSQLSGFAKKRDLSFFTKKVIGGTYEHESLLAPTLEMLDAYKKDLMSWSEYEARYLKLIEERRIESRILPSEVDGRCFLCSEDLPHKCHRRLAAEYLASQWSETVQIVHL
jgi:hypothetical protein